MTFNNVIAALENFAANHLMINSFLSGDTWDFQAQTNAYPSMLAVTYPAVIGSGMTRMSFQIFFSDIANKDRSNVNEIHSDTLQIAQDLFAYLRDNEDELGFSLATDELSLEPFSESFDDVLVGWSMLLEIDLPFAGSACNLPLNISF